ncbi:DUF4129 domain-containing protein [Kitasatospora sp. NPDC058170]|uniref:DUF4129 domain-containing protein n=1 Tax=Kitasatospora sp. NPDC058170 TaxID=3346364 RepID=UPI0036DA0E95
MHHDAPPNGPRPHRRHRRWAGAPAGRIQGLLLVGGGLLLAAAALRPDGGLLGTATAPPVAAGGFVALLALGWLALAGRFASRFREEVRRLAGPTPWAERMRSAAVVLMVGAVPAVPLLMYAFHRRGAVAPPVEPPQAAWLPEPAPTATQPPKPFPEPADPSPLPALLLFVLATALAVLLLVAAVALVRWLLRGGRLRRLRTLPPTADGPAPGEDVLAAAVATGRRALDGGDPRAAVIACYAAMEGSLAASGVARRACDSPTELLERAVADDRVDPVHAHALTALFREARYSTHPMDDTHVHRARLALDTIAERLTDRTDEASQADRPDQSDRTGRADRSDRADQADRTSRADPADPADRTGARR